MVINTIIHKYNLIKYVLRNFHAKYAFHEFTFLLRVHNNINIKLIS